MFVIISSKPSDPYEDIQADIKFLGWYQPKFHYLSSLLNDDDIESQF